MTLSRDTLSIFGEYLLRRKVTLAAAQAIVAPAGVTIREEPTGFTFWKAGRRIFGAFSFQSAKEFA
jgi:hypothetical protein